jgi:hypothetical protein
MTLDLTDDETAALTRLLRRTINDDPYPLSPRLAPLKAILAKLDPDKPCPELPPPLKSFHGALCELPAPAAMNSYRGPSMTLGNANGCPDLGAPSAAANYTCHHTIFIAPIYRK